jgi:hypothetical protein
MTITSAQEQTRLHHSSSARFAASKDGERVLRVLVASEFSGIVRDASLKKGTTFGHATCFPPSTIATAISKATCETSYMTVGIS